MNTGMFPMPSGQLLSARRLRAMGGSSPVQLQSTISSFGTISRATTVTAAATPAGVRTRLLSILDRGAVRAIGIDGGGTDTTRVELVVDGVTIFDRTITAAASTIYGIVGFGGGGASPVFVPDFIPFDASVELWVTRSTLTTTNFAFNVDLHQ